MATQESSCEHCDKPISPKAKACPNCGHPIAEIREKRFQTKMRLLAVVFVLGVGVYGYSTNPIIQRIVDTAVQNILATAKQ